MAAVYALLVGINGYASKPLQGCIRDVQAVQEYLQTVFDNRQKNSLHLRILTDETEEKPTRENLISAFRFFDNAAKGDVCLFYYSGHGSFTRSPDEFYSSDGYMQSFVCLDSRLPGGKDLMDKEMSYLIWKTLEQKPGLRFLAITDCCHSGTITKALTDRSEVTDRMMPAGDHHTPVTVEDYLGFGEAYDKDPATGKYKVRQGRHIHIAAAQDQQTAKELIIDGEKRGAFTHSLLKTLYTFNSNLSYSELTDRTAALVKNLVQDQDPALNINGGESGTDNKQLPFLSGTASTPADQYFVFHDPKAGWCVKAGPAQGVFPGDKLRITENLYSLVISTLSPSLSVIMSKPGLGTPQNAYQASVIRKQQRLQTISFADEVPEQIRQLFWEGNFFKETGLARLVTDTAGQYIIHARPDNHCSLSLPGSTTPLFKPLQITQAGEAADFAARVENVIRWKQLLLLDNPSTSIRPEQYTIKLYVTKYPGMYDPADPDAFEEVTSLSAPTELPYRKSGSGWYKPAFRLSITNHSANELFTGCAYLCFDYAIYTHYFETQTIGPGKTAWLAFTAEGQVQDVIKATLDDKYREAGYYEITEYLKLFIGTEKPDLRHLSQEGIELPVLKATADKSAGRSLGGDEKKSTPSGWTTETLGLKISWPPDEIRLTANQPIRTGNLDVQAPAGFSCSLNLSGSAHGTKSAKSVQPPHLAWRNSYLSPLDLSSDTRAGLFTDILELTDIKGKEQINAANELKITLGQSAAAADEDIIPVGYDPATGLYYALGYANGNQIFINQLPPETPTEGSVAHKSLTGSVKIYFQKIWGGKKRSTEKLTRLAIAGFDNGKAEYISDLTILKERVSAANRMVLFIHGIIGDTEGMAACTQTCFNEAGETIAGKYDLVLSFDYENLNTPIEQTAALLKEKLMAAGLTEGHSKELVIVAHSMGGLVSRVFIEQLGGDKIVSRLVMLGTPNNGSAWADVRDLAEVLFTYALNGAAFLKPWLWALALLRKPVQGMQVTLRQMDAETGIYNELNTGKDPGIPYVIIAGNTQKIIVRYDETCSLLRRIFSFLNKKTLYQALDTTLFRQPNDIAVSVESITGLAGSAHWLFKPVIHEIDCDHLNYFEQTKALALL